jgi:two-component system nitrogen regulation response regulator GlnG
VLIRGESGTGKELVARAIQEASPRARGPFVAVNMAAIPATTAAAELFGHTAGAFTGAQRDAPGLFARADGGTIFLDEVGESPVEVQAALLRVLASGEVQPVGGGGARRVNVRVLSATDLDLEESVERGTFREPLLHRLSGFVLLVPPLRERRDDVGRLFAHFLPRELEAVGEGRRLATLAGRDPYLGPEVLRAFLLSSWPGNVRQLRNWVQQLVVCSRGEPRARLPAALAGAARAAPARPAAPVARRRPSEIGEAALLEALRRNGWQTGATAAELGISRTSLYALIDGSRTIRKAKSVPPDELRQVFAECDGDVDVMSARLEVSRRGLQLRLKEVGL